MRFLKVPVASPFRLEIATALEISMLQAGGAGEGRARPP